MSWIFSGNMHSGKSFWENIVLPCSGIIILWKTQSAIMALYGLRLVNFTCRGVALAGLSGLKRLPFLVHVVLIRDVSMYPILSPIATPPLDKTATTSSSCEFGSLKYIGYLNLCFSSKVNFTHMTSSQKGNLVSSGSIPWENLFAENF